MKKHSLLKIQPSHAMVLFVLAAFNAGTAAAKEKTCQDSSSGSVHIKYDKSGRLTELFDRENNRKAEITYNKVYTEASLTELVSGDPANEEEQTWGPVRMIKYLRNTGKIDYIYTYEDHQSKEYQTEFKIAENYDFEKDRKEDGTISYTGMSEQLTVSYQKVKNSKKKRTVEFTEPTNISSAECFSFAGESFLLKREVDKREQRGKKITKTITIGQSANGDARVESDNKKAAKNVGSGNNGHSAASGDRNSKASSTR